MSVTDSAENTAQSATTDTVSGSKSEIINEYRVHERDTGSPEVQVALLSSKVEALTQHLKKSPKDYSSQRGLSMKVAQRRKLLDYLKSKSTERYAKLIGDLGLRR